MNKQIRKPAVAGMFYPASPDRLKEEISNYLRKVASVKTEGEIVAIISPHAGYEFSGGVAAYGFKAIEGKDFSTVIIIGPSHYVYFKGSSIYPEGYYRTPLGDVEIDKELAKKLINGSNIRFYPPAHQREHSVEVQIPFLQTVLKDFKIVPIVMGNCSYQDCLDLGKAIAENVKDKRILIIASTDLSHFYPSEEARPLDKITLNEIRRFNPRELYQKVQTEECQLCGAMPVVATLLLEIAREAIESYVNKQERIKIKETNPKLREKRGVFVTLTKSGQLRGCIGYIQPIKPLCEAVRDMAIEAAVNDPRFTPLQKGELNEIEIEISVLSPLKKIENVTEIEVGRDGIFIKKGFHSGLLLPQVATENNWDREEFLRHTCYKAGLPSDAWKEGAEIYIFSAEIFK